MHRMHRLQPTKKYKRDSPGMPGSALTIQTRGHSHSPGRGGLTSNRVTCLGLGHETRYPILHIRLHQLRRLVFLLPVLQVDLKTPSVLSQL